MRILAIPVKSLSRAKTRLAPVLSPLERGALTLAMLEDMLDVTLEIPGWETWVVSPDEVALEISARRGAKAIPEDKGPLSAAIRQVEILAKDREADALAVLPGDLAMVTADALHVALHTLGAVVLAAAADGTGTSFLLRRPPRAIPARFGPDSFAKHRALADERGLGKHAVLAEPEALAAIASAARGVPTPGSTTARCTPSGMNGRVFASVSAPWSTPCGEIPCVMSMISTSGAIRFITP
jgi:2-phospho-L-lactate guanylyltransferase